MVLLTSTKHLLEKRRVWLFSIALRSAPHLKGKENTQLYEYFMNNELDRLRVVLSYFVRKLRTNYRERS